MTDQLTSSFVRQTLVEPRKAPIKTIGVVGFVRQRLLNSPLNIVLTAREPCAARVDQSRQRSSSCS